ncbi:MAG TPA: alpha-glucuronidase family glycosyl hydrolase [Terriglobia bacterium]|nr:alpha-glucuronidase family glycosyl hydrolase [Terriglobia bacterium]
MDKNLVAIVKAALLIFSSSNRLYFSPIIQDLEGVVRSYGMKAGRFLLASCVLMAGFAIPALPRSSPSLPIAEGGKARASIVLGEGASPAYRYAAAELQKYLHDLSGAQFSIIPDSQLSTQARQQTLIFVGGPLVNPSVSPVMEKAALNLSTLKPGGFVIQTTRLKDHPVVVVAGRDGFSTLYGVYDLVKRLGVTFLLTGDIIPKQRDSLSIPKLNIRQDPAFPRRGFLLPEVYEHLTMFSYADYAKFLDQMAKMKCNYLQVWWFSYEPFLKFSYKGETKWMGDVSTKESGYMDWAYGGFGSRTTDDVTIGKHWFEQFLKGKRTAPPEMQDVETPDQAFSVAETLLRRIIHHAHERGIKVWLAIEIASLPPNLARFCDRVGDLPFNRVFGTFVQPLDPTNREIQTNRLRALFASYPNADGYFLIFPEMYPEINTPKYRAFYQRMRPAFFQLRALRWPWVVDIAGSSDLVVDSNAGTFDLFKYLLKQRDEIDPKAEIGLMGVGRGYALPVFDKMLPKDIPFTDLESSGIWTPTGIPMKDFGGMGSRERTIQVRIDDDFDMMGMQFNVSQFSEKDRIFTDGVKYGLSGYAGQVERARGTETNSLFIAEAGWKPNLTPQEFYKDYSERLFGAAAASDMYEAFMTLEKNQAYIGYGNYGFSTMNCCGYLPEVNAARLYSQQPDAYDGPTTAAWKRFIMNSPDAIVRYEGSIHLLNQVLGHLRKALPRVAPRGRYELQYLINRTESYRDYMQSLITIRKATLDFDAAFQQKSEISQDQLVSRLNASLQEFELAGQQVRTATGEYAQMMDHPSDLGVLYQLNIRAVLGFKLVLQWMQDVVNFQEGKPYLTHVPWEKLSSPDPHDLTSP